MYCDEVNLTGDNVMGVLYLSKKYILPSLTDKCTEYLQDKLDPSNVLSILPLAQKYEEQNLVDRCWKVVDEWAKEVVKPGNGFMTIERSLLEAIIVRDTLNIKEVELFCAVDLWARKECDRQGLPADGETKRRILGQKIVKAIRFPTMDQVDFAVVALESKILTTEEIVSVIKHMNSVSLPCPVGFPDHKRSGYLGEIQYCCRFDTVAHHSWSYGSLRDCINVSTDRDIYLHGLRLFGRENNSYWVDLEIKNAENRSVLLSKTGWFASGLLPIKLGHFYGFEVLFDEILLLKRHVIYSIEGLITGSASLSGANGHKDMKCSGVTITFINSKYSGNGTSIRQGQFPELVFSI